MSRTRKQPSPGGRKQGEGEAAAKAGPLMKLALCLTPREQRRLAGMTGAQRNRKPGPRN